VRLGFEPGVALAHPADLVGGAGVSAPARPQLLAGGVEEDEPAAHAGRADPPDVAGAHLGEALPHAVADQRPGRSGVELDRPGVLGVGRVGPAAPGAGERLALVADDDGAAAARPRV